MRINEPHRQSTDLFDPPDYTSWCRKIIGVLPQNRNAHILFDSTIAEPTALLQGVVRRAFGAALTDRYESTFANGNPHVVQALARRYGVAADRILTTTGAVAGLAMVVRAHLRDGGHVIVERPGFDLLQDVAAESGATVDFVSREPGTFALDPARLAALLRPDTRLIVLTNLHNPSSVRLDDEALLALAAVARPAGVRIVVDEVYADFAGGRPAATLSPDFISLNSLTKVYGLSTLRCGWILAEPQILKLVRDSHTGDLGISRLTHALAALVLEDIEPFDAHWRQVLAANRVILEQHESGMRADGLLDGAIPPHGCTWFPEVCGVSDTRALARRLWDRHRIVVAPGEFFGRPGHIRIGFGRDAVALDRGLALLGEALREELFVRKTRITRGL